MFTSRSIPIISLELRSLFIRFLPRLVVLLLERLVYFLTNDAHLGPMVIDHLLSPPFLALVDGLSPNRYGGIILRGMTNDFVREVCGVGMTGELRILVEGWF